MPWLAANVGWVHRHDDTLKKIAHELAENLRKIKACNERVAA